MAIAVVGRNEKLNIRCLEWVAKFRPPRFIVLGTGRPSSYRMLLTIYFLNCKFLVQNTSTSVKIDTS